MAIRVLGEFDMPSQDEYIKNRRAFNFAMIRYVNNPTDENFDAAAITGSRFYKSKSRKFGKPMSAHFERVGK